MERNEFLKTIWNSYPEAPANARALGRLVQITSENSGCRIEIWRDGQNQQFDLPKSPSLSQVLREGDLVALLPDNEILLLAPGTGSFDKAFPKERLQKWNRYLRDVRAFFEDQDFVEVKTPQLVVCPGTEPSLDVFSTELKIGSRLEKLFLPTSPELHLKKALAQGAEKIFELAWCYRNGEVTERHQPEFLMLEWYRAFDNLETIKKDVVSLVQDLAAKMQTAGPKKVYSKSISQLFQDYCQFNLRPDTSLEELKELGEKLGVDVRSAETIDDYFFLIFMEKIEAVLPPEDLIFVEKYPPYQAALARLTPDGWGDRFEVYWKGMELANAFHELNNPEIQRDRSREDLEKKTAMGKEKITLDEEFFKALDGGMPPSGGIALGVERLYMALTGLEKISQIRLFPLK
ncbi:EF-P lysine aminoacylase EpmA [Bdellovibrio sp. HCB2-146]|uniref:EF-P lysine aminoacylase EpmA n=1 Tax=Bdellovibrio sp. HCB2-146 TaxID=3394362 RepID=UPI0039BD505A